MNKIPLAYADVELQLAAAISIGDTSITLSSANDDDGNALPAGKYCFTVDNGSSNKEYLLGQLNGTNLTSVVSVSRQGVESSGAARAHRVGAPAILSDFAAIQRVVDILRGQETVDGANPISYDAEPTLTDRKELATVAYVLDNITGGTVAFDSQIVTGVNAGETVAAGKLVYFKTSDQEWYLADASVAVEVNGVHMGIALGAGTDGAAITGGVQISGSYTTTGLTAGATYYATDVAGVFGTSAGTTNRVIGVALSTTELLLVPVTPESLTTDEKAALVGDGGTPSATNPYKVKSKTVTAGATINGATLPVPVYQNTTDNEFYACDANDTAAMKYLGFAITNGVNAGDFNVQFSGIVSGFTGLAEGEEYYVQDAVGTIGTTIGTNEILVGVAISETELLIQKGQRRAAGTFSIGTVTTDVTLTTGFRPSVIRFTAQNVVAASTPDSMRLECVYANGALSALASIVNGTSSQVSESTRLYDVNNWPDYYMTFSVQSITDTSFIIRYTETGTYDQGGVVIWEAEGEI